MDTLNCGYESDLVAAQYSLCALQIGEAMGYKNLTIFPLGYRGGPKGIVGKEPASRKRRYQLLADAIEGKSAKVEEVSDGGEVPFLAVDNQGALPVLIPEGEILIGAKQNRTVNLTVLVGGKSTFKLPVSCVEQGRWHYRSREFEPAAFAAPKLREGKVRSAQFNRRAHGMAVSDQGEVWAQIAEHMDDLKVESPTMDFTPGFEAVEDRLDVAGGLPRKNRAADLNSLFRQQEFGQV